MNTTADELVINVETYVDRRLPDVGDDSGPEEDAVIELAADGEGVEGIGAEGPETGTDDSLNSAPTVVWLDYTSPRERYSQLKATQTLVSRLRSPSIVKVTLNADPLTLGQKTRESPEELGNQRAEVLSAELDDLAPAAVTASDVTTEHLPETLAEAVRIAGPRSRPAELKPSCPAARVVPVRRWTASDAHRHDGGR